MNPHQWIDDKVRDAPRFPSSVSKLFIFLQRGGLVNEPTTFEPWEMMHMARILGEHLFDLEDEMRRRAALRPGAER